MHPRQVYFVPLILLAIFSVAPISGAFNGSKAVWLIDVNAEGDARVVITLQVEGGVNDVWILLPSGDTLSFTPNPSPTTFTYSRVKSGYFYDNYTFHFINTSKLSICYSFRRASLFEENQGLFLSPLIMLDPRVYGEVKIRLSNAGELLHFTPSPRYYQKIGEYYVLNYTIPLTPNLDQREERIWVFYSLIEPVESKRLNMGLFEAKISELYFRDIDAMFRRLTRVNTKMSQFFGFNLSNIRLIFYVPETLESVGGYTPVHGGVMSSEIHINLLMLRYVKGYLDLVTVHELMHHYVWRSGIDPELRWFHEGAATFFSVKFLLSENLDGVEMYYRDISSTAKRLDDVGFLLDWRGGCGDALHYAAAFKVFEELNSTFGLEFFKRLFREMKARNAKISTSREIFEVMRVVSNGASDDVLARLGLTKSIVEVEDKTEASASRYYLDQILKVSAVILAVAIIVLMAISLIHLRTARAEPYLTPSLSEKSR